MPLGDAWTAPALRRNGLHLIRADGAPKGMDGRMEGFARAVISGIVGSAEASKRVLAWERG